MLRGALLLSLLLAQGVWAGTIPFSLHKHGSANKSEPTVLIIGGIQGDEPGGFHAASLLVTNYRVSKGQIWVVPNLNFESIIHRSRGVNGDMNRKFAQLDPDDPDFEAVDRIKKLISNEAVDFVFNLHDGSGYYRTEYIDPLHSPLRWGQSIIIDQAKLEQVRYGNLDHLAGQVATLVNQNLLDDEHRYSVKNTETRLGDVEMAKTLTFYAINQGKPAVGIEASKDLPTHKRAYYHLQVVEGYLKQLGVEFERDFQLDANSVRNVIDNNVRVAFYENQILLDMVEARNHIRYFPLRKDSDLIFSASNPLVAITDRGQTLKVTYGNRRITNLYPQFFHYDNSLKQVGLTIDGQERKAALGSVWEVNDRFKVDVDKGFRVNVIGWRKSGIQNEAEQLIHRDELDQNYSVDRRGTLYRVEVYRDDKFNGMLLMRFTEPGQMAQQPASALNEQASGSKSG